MNDRIAALADLPFVFVAAWLLLLPRFSAGGPAVCPVPPKAVAAPAPKAGGSPLQDLFRAPGATATAPAAAETQILWETPALAAGAVDLEAAAGVGAPSFRLGGTDCADWQALEAALTALPAATPIRLRLGDGISSADWERLEQACRTRQLLPFLPQPKSAP